MLYLFFLLLSNICMVGAAPEPVMIAELFRHGARTTLFESQVETDDYVEKVGKGNLTPNGMRMHYMLGRQIRDVLYPTLFQTPYNQSSIEVYSTSVNRTMMSVYSQLQGLFPVGTGSDITGEGPDILPPNLNFSVPTPETNKAIPPGMMSFPIHTLPKDEDDLFIRNFSSICPAASLLNDKAMAKGHEDLDLKIQDLKADLKKRLQDAGFKVDKLFPDSYEWLRQIAHFADTLIAYKNYHSKYPKGIDAELYRVIDTAGALWYQVKYDNIYSKILTTPLTKKILGTFDDKIAGKRPALKFLGLSAHDSTQWPFFTLMKFSVAECLIRTIKNKGIKPDGEKWCYGLPPYASNMIFELSSQTPEGSNEKEYYIRLLLNGVVVDTICPKDVKVVGEGYCPYQDAKQELTKVLIWTDDFEKACGSKKTNSSSSTSTSSDTSTSSSSNSLLLIIGGLILAVIIIAFGILIFVYIKFNKSGQQLGNTGGQNMDQSSDNNGYLSVNGSGV